MTSYSKYLKKNLIIFITLLIVFITIVINISTQYYFDTFLDQQIDEKNVDIIFTLDSILEEGQLTNQTIRTLSTSNNVIIKIYTGDKTLIYDTTQLNSNGMMYGQGKRMQNPIFTEETDITTIQYQTYYLPDYNSNYNYYVDIGRNALMPSEDQFINSLNRIMVLVLLISLLIIFFFSNQTAKKIIEPIQSIGASLKHIDNQTYNYMKVDHLNFQEINDLQMIIKSLNDRLENQSNLRKRLTTDMAHELRNPLAVLRSYIEALVDGVRPANEENLLKCNDEIIKLTRLIDELNQFSQIESQIILNASDCNISEIISNQLDRYKPLLNGHHMKLVNEIAPNLYCHVDEGKIIQVFDNLISNAIKYSPNSSSIIVRLNRDSSKLHTLYFSVIDYGIGISKEDLPYIFERFYRSDQSRNKSTGGLGIGLSIVKAICDAHNFSITVESEIKKGTTFTVEMPENNFKIS